MVPLCKKNIRVVKQETLYYTGSAPALEGNIFTLDKPMIDYDFVRFDWLAATIGDMSKSVNVST